MTLNTFTIIIIRTYALNIIFRLSYNDRCFLIVGAYFEVQPQRMPALPAQAGQVGQAGRLNLFAKKDRCVSPKYIKKYPKKLKVRKYHECPPAGPLRQIEASEAGKPTETYFYPTHSSIIKNSFLLPIGKV